MKKAMKFQMAALIALLIGLLAFGATIDATVGGAGFPANGAGQCYVVKSATLDLSATAVASNDVVQLIPVPANAVVLSVQYDVVTAATNAVTFDLGDDANAAGYVSNISATNAAGWVSSGLSATLAGKLYTADNTIDAHFDGAPGSTGAIRITAVMIRAVKE